MLITLMKKTQRRWMSLAAKGIGACGNVELSRSLWDVAVPWNLLPKYKHWLRDSGGVGESSGVGLPEMLQSLVAEGCLVQGGGGSVARYRKMRKNSLSQCVFFFDM